MEYHKKYGGVVPSLAKLAHIDRIDNVVNESLTKAKKKLEDIDYFAVTIGPGLAIALEVGIKKAKELALEYKKPLITINHMEGHLLSGFAKRNSKDKASNFRKDFYDKYFPSLGVLVSGGHTELVHVDSIGAYKKIGETLDDALGECLDKCGRILGLGYPAGAIISKFAKENRKNIEFEIKNHNKSTVLICKNIQSKAEYELPIAMARTESLDMSYSGVKTAFFQLVEKLSSTNADELANKFEQDKQISKGLKKEQIYDLCNLLEEAVYEQLVIKVKKAINQKQYQSILLGGGVVASARLKSKIRKIAKDNNLELVVPYSKKLTTDNAAMIGISANLGLLYNTSAIATDLDKVDREPGMVLDLPILHILK